MPLDSDSHDFNSLNWAGIGLIFIAGLPQHVDGDLICCGNQLTSLKGIADLVKHVGGHLCSRDNPIVGMCLNWPTSIVASGST